MHYSSFQDSGLAIGAIIGIVVLAVAIGLIPLIFYLLTLQNTLKAVSVPNQKMPPGQVWLLLIPVFGTVWHFIVVNRIADSLKAELDMRQMPSAEQRPAFGVGLAMCICQCCGFIPLVGPLSALVLWIIYWVKVAGYKRQLLESTAKPMAGI